VAKRDNAVPTALGFRVKSGRAIAVLLAVRDVFPCVLDHREIDLCDPAVAESRQPYHAGMGQLETDLATLKRRRQVVTRAAERSIRMLVKEYRGVGYEPRCAGLVVGSLINPETISNPHIRAHALEGQLFRTVLEDWLRACEITSTVFLERDLYGSAAKVLQRSESELKRILARPGKQVAPPWRSDEKGAALAAWMVLRAG
jgi:hypothetical protein